MTKKTHPFFKFYVVMAGILGSVLFWLLGTYILPLTQGYIVLGMVGWFIAFGAGAFFSFQDNAPKT